MPIISCCYSLYHLEKKLTLVRVRDRDLFWDSTSLTASWNWLIRAESDLMIRMRETVITRKLNHLLTVLQIVVCLVFAPNYGLDAPFDYAIFNTDLSIWLSNSRTKNSIAHWFQSFARSETIKFSACIRNSIFEFITFHSNSTLALRETQKTKNNWVRLDTRNT